MATLIIFASWAFGSPIYGAWLCLSLPFDFMAALAAITFAESIGENAARVNARVALSKRETND